MKTRNGIYAARKTENGVEAVYIDEETIEDCELSKMLAANRARKDQADAAEQERRIRAGKRQLREERALRRVVKQGAKLLGIGGIVGLAWRLGLVEPGFAVPMLLCLQSLLGFWVGKFMSREREN